MTCLFYRSTGGQQDPFKETGPPITTAAQQFHAKGRRRQELRESCKRTINAVVSVPSSWLDGEVVQRSLGSPSDRKWPRVKSRAGRAGDLAWGAMGGKIEGR